MMDFFLDDEIEQPSTAAAGGSSLMDKVKPQPAAPSTPTPSATAAASTGGADVTLAMDQLKKQLSADLVAKVKGIYAFNITGLLVFSSFLFYNISINFDSVSFSIC